MTSSEPVVSVTGLTKRYGDHVALDGVTFEIERGETFALLGPNGAGKSTTIEILEGYRRRSGGTARVLGVDPGTAGVDWKARLGIVLQGGAEPGTAKVREQLAHFASFFPRPRDVDETLASVGLTEAAQSRVRALSGGQRRRLDVALGIIGRPEVLFLDEPTTGFDPEARRQFWGLIRELKAAGTTILLTTHYLDEAAALSDRAAVIAGGHLVDLAPIDEIGPADARIPLVSWRDADGLHEVRTTEPATLVARLVAAEDGEPRDVEIRRPSLEDVYLRLIGEDVAA
ncbi:ABC transporter ATP-binding protein [uncultured Amnibacterium sp.]|uniref:ABC transporter ATP-binding protein n=1 Tax=uncultured Amnibacterium sp. TaxID=1631851 RepID=UPI0035CA2A08